MTKVKVHVKFAGTRIFGMLVITISDASCSRSCNFLTRRDLSFIFGYVVSMNMSFIHRNGGATYMGVLLAII